MNTETAATEAVVHNHLRAFLEQKGIAAIVNDYDESARFYSEAEIYHGKQQIGGFFADFLDSLPTEGIDRFALRSQRVDRNIAYITWSVGTEIPLGTDTFVVANGKIVSQTFAMYHVCRAEPIALGHATRPQRSSVPKAEAPTARANREGGVVE